MAEYDALLEPFQLKHLTIRNRIVSTSHALAYAERAMPGECYQLYHVEKARGGIGMTMFGGSSNVSPDCPATFGQLGMSGDRIVPHLRQFSRRVHGHGAALMCQITHMGRRTCWDSGDWLPSVAPTALRAPEHGSFPVAPYLAMAGAIKAAVDIPVIHAGHIPDLVTAARAIQEGHVDLVAMTRSHMGDPHIAAKLRMGRVEDIRECVGANYCIDGIYLPGEALCIQNPATAREATMSYAVTRGDGAKRRVVVAGDGPAGPEATRVAALRGH
jgi:2,4-dienoyl-CoA reductase-like NADH-dependent reductase (Old Yellow Enzyme family)